MIKSFISYFKPYKKLFFLDLLAAIFVSCIDLVYPKLTRSLLNTYIKENNIKAVLIAAGILLVLYIIKLFLNFFMGYQGHNMSSNMQKDMRNDLFAHLESLPITFFDNNKTGVLISRTTSDLQDVAELAHHGPEDLLTSIVLLLGSTIIMFRMNWLLSLIMVCFLPPMVLLVAKLRKSMKKAMKESREKIGEMSAVLENSITGIRVSKAYSAEVNEEKRFQECNESFYTTRRRVNHNLGTFNAGMTFCNDFLYWIILLIGGLFVIFTNKGNTDIFKLDYLDLVTFMLYVNVFLQPLRKITGFIEQYQNGMTGFQRFYDIMEENPEALNDGETTLEKLDGDIAFNDVCFSYNDSKQILNHVSFKLPKGKTVALVGPTGGGKSTICHLIPRFYDISSGEITIANKNIQNYTRQSLRDKIGIVAQDVFMFDATISDNIAYGNPNASQEDIMKAARLANLSEFIESLPDGINTVVGERGVKLSGGQKQRVSIARAFLKNPPLLILDEATSALDTVTEQMIQDSLNQLAQGRTVLVVAHRLSTIQNADEILVVENGEIKEHGNHQELLKQNGKYAELYKISQHLDVTFS